MHPILGFLLTAPLLLASSTVALAQEFPSRPVTLIVGYPAGGGPDVEARVLGARLSARLGQPVIVENRPGASGLIGANAVARSNPDGHTLLFAPNTLLMAPQVLPKEATRGLDVLKDLAPVVSPSRSTQVMVAHPSLGVRDALQLADYVRKNPGLPYATPGNGSPMHIAGELFKDAAGIDMLHVAYKGVAPALADVLGGQVKVTYAGLAVVKPYLADGRLVALASVENTRSPLMPELSTLIEQGFKDASVNAWYGVFAPRGTPARVIDHLNREFNAVLAEPEVSAKLKSLSEIPLGGTSEALAETVRQEYAAYGKVIKKLNISGE